MNIKNEIQVAIKMLKGLLRESDRLGTSEIMRVRRVIDILEAI
tara:strand:- start:295 stop:423 length:129 start_codon:yes stop_codon:yes gene_type:complete